MSNYATITNLANTGSTLENAINSLSEASVLLYEDQTIDGLKNFTSTPTVNNVNVALSSNVVDLNSEQTIYGNKYFLGEIYLSDGSSAVSSTYFQHNLDNYKRNNLVDLYDSQTILGQKNFSTRPLIYGLPILNEQEVVNVQNDQYINGLKTFRVRPEVNGIGVALQNEQGGNQGVFYLTGYQVVEGNKVFSPQAVTKVANLTFLTKSGELDVVSVSQPDNASSQKIDYIDVGLSLSRADENIYNTSIEEAAGYYSPRDTAWNADGWENLQDVAIRTYISFYEANGFYITSFTVTGKNWVMKDIKNNKYYKVKFTNYEDNYNGNDGFKGFTYTRQEVGPNVIALLSGKVEFNNIPTINGARVVLEGQVPPIDTAVLNTGDQTINGLKNFSTRPTVNNTGVALFGEGVPTPIQIFGNNVSQGNAAALNFIGGGISVSTVGGVSSINVVAGNQTYTIPTSSTSVGTSGAFAFDKNYIYYCKENNKWVRTALSEW
jgi:hypothetical protein